MQAKHTSFQKNSLKTKQNKSSKIWTKLTDGHQHLCSVIESIPFCGNYVSSLIAQLCKEITKLYLIAKIHLQAAYFACKSGYKYKFTLLMKTIKNIVNFMLSLDRVIKQKLIPALFDDFQISEELRSLNSTSMQIR